MIRLILSLTAIVCLASNSNLLTAQGFVKTHWNVDAKNDIFKFGTFDKPGDVNVPDGWQNLSAFDSGNATFSPRGLGMISLNSPTDDGDVYIETMIDVPADAKYLTFMVRQRGPMLTKTSKPASGGGVRFSLIKGDTVTRTLNRIEPSYEGYRNWTIAIQTIQVMPSEDTLRIRVEITNATGSLDINKILVVPSEIMKEATVEQQRQLDQALAKDDPELIQQLIKAAPHMLEVRTGNHDNGTPLIRTAFVGAPKVAAALVKLGADIEAKDSNWGNTPLRWCCWWGIPDVAEILMEAGADANGASAMARSSKTNNSFTKRTPEDFDRTVKVIEDQLEKRKSK